MITISFCYHSMNFVKKKYITDPIFVDTDYEKTLIVTLQGVIYTTKYNIHPWLVDKNLFINFKI